MEEKNISFKPVREKKKIKKRNMAALLKHCTHL